MLVLPSAEPKPIALNEAQFYFSVWLVIDFCITEKKLES